MFERLWVYGMKLIEFLECGNVNGFKLPILLLIMLIELRWSRSVAHNLEIPIAVYVQSNLHICMQLRLDGILGY